MLESFSVEGFAFLPDETSPPSRSPRRGLYQLTVEAKLLPKDADLLRRRAEFGFL